MQPKIGPQAAAALQAGAKRKLPESFQQQPVRSKHSKAKPAPISNAARAASPPAVRQPAVRICAPSAQEPIATAYTDDVSDGTTDLPPTVAREAAAVHRVHPAMVADSLKEPGQGESDLQKPASQAPAVQRRLPESLTKLQTSATVSRSIRPGSQPVPTTALAKLGPSEHDTKVALRAALEGLQSSGGIELNVPAGRMAIPLMKHQRLALAWMLHRERSAANPRGGILADDQGLGKTVSTIALIVTNQRGDDIADEGFEDVTSDADDDVEHNADADANAIATKDACSDARSVNADSRLIPSAPGTISAPATAVTSDSGEISLPASLNAQQHGQPAAVSDAASNSSLLQSKTAAAQKAAEQHSVEAEVSGRSNTAGLPEGGTLIVCPTAVLNQWARELQSKVAPPAGMTVYVYHGKGRGVKAQQLARYSCVLTTYTSMGMEAPSRAHPKQGAHSDLPIPLEDDFDDSTKGGGGKGKKGTAGPLFEIWWWRVVLDESQAIKNANTLVAHAAHCLQAGRRWCLSGTPIQNSIDDLYSCFCFLRYHPYCKRAAFKAMLKDPLQDDPAKGAQLLQICLKAVLLRRTKSSTIDGEAVVKLPPRQQQLLCKPFTAAEQRFYDQVQQESMQKLKDLEQGGGGSSYVNMLWLLLRLRQACNHPWLVRGTTAQYEGAGACPPAAALSPPAGKVSASQLSAAKKLAGQMREQLQQTLQQEPSVCVQCGDISEDAVVSACHHVFCRQCITMQVGSLGSGKDNESNFNCPACSQPLSAGQIFTAPALKKAGVQGKGLQGAAPGGQPQTGWHSSSKVEHLLELLRGTHHRGPAGRPSAPGSNLGSSSHPLGGRSKSDARLAAILGAPAHKSNPTSAPVHSQEKVIVFSQWTSMLDLIEIALKKEKFTFRRLDGSMSMANRDQAIVDFQEKPNVNILIVSLKAAALGLNLVAANHVILLDLWWNPTIEEQAIDRAHRIGQTRTVHVTRITIAGTVEERILALQDSKRKIVSAAFDDDSGSPQQSNRLTKEDLHFLFTGQR